MLRVGDKPIENFGELIVALTRTNGVPTAVQLVREGDQITVESRYSIPAMIASMRADGRALAAGMRPGDIVTAVDGTQIASARQLQLLVAESTHGEPLTFTVERDDDVLDITFTPELVTREHPETGVVEPVPTMGVGLPTFGGLLPVMVLGNPDGSRNRPP